MQSGVMKTIYDIGIVPVVSLTDAEGAVGLAKAMIRGGLPVLEVAFRTEEAPACIAAIAKACPEMALGAGTVLSPEQVELAAESGAKFVVSPGYDAEVVARCAAIGMPVIPGIVNATDIQRCLRAGLTTVKFFPSEPMGGLATIDYLAAPFAQVKFLPAGGVGFENLGEYLSSEHVFACAGGFVARAGHIQRREWDTVTALCRRAVLASHGFSLAHVGINCQDAGVAERAAEWFDAALGLEKKEGNRSVFAGTAVELMKAPYLGSRGHIGFAVNSVERAKAYLETQGQRFLPDTVRYDAKGRMQSAYLEGDVEGFAVHLVLRKK